MSASSAIKSVSARARSAARPLVGGNLGFTAGLAIAAATAVLAVAVAVMIRSPGATSAPDAPALPISIGGLVFNIPPAAIRVPLQRRAGAQDRVDLAFLWPQLSPPDPNAKPAASDAFPAFDRIFVTIVPADDSLRPPDRIKTIYPRYFDFGRFAGPEGLLVVRFRDGTPYQGEDLFYDPGQPEGFVARCSRPGAGPTPGMCLWERRLGDAADLTVRFPRDWLSDWREVMGKIERLIAALQTQASGQ